MSNIDLKDEKQSNLSYVYYDLHEVILIGQLTINVI
jgi:hypothetical protein